MKKLVPIEDIEYLAQQSSGQLNMIVAGMTELINSNAEKTAMLENQGWFQRMINSITGKNKATKEEIRRNHDKINLYVSQALTELYKQNCLDRKIMMSLGNQLNEIYADHLQLKQMLGMFICRLNEKIESVDNFHVLNTEIEQGVYNTGSKIVAICGILSQLDNRSIKESRKIDIIRRSMEQQGILNDEEKILGDYLVEIAELPIDEVGLVYSEMNTIRANFIANLISNTIEAYHFLPDIKRRTKKKQAVVQNVVQQEDFDFDAPLSTSVIWQELIESKIDMVNGLLPVSKDQFGREIAEAEQLYLQCRFDEAFTMFQTLAEQGNERAFYFMAEYYGNGYGSAPLDNNSSNEWRAKCEQAKNPLARVEATYTKSVQTGEFEQVANEIIDDLIKLADDGDLFACFEIYGLVEYGYKGITYELAEQYALTALEKGHWGIANSLGVHYNNLSDYTKANEYYKMGSKISSPWAQYNLAYNYEIGRGIEKNDAMAFELYKSSAEKGCVYAQHSLGNWYHNGHYVNQDYAEAVKWFSKAAHKNYVLSQNMLGVCYYDGRGVTQDYTEAVKWYKLAAEQKDNWAQCNLAECYYYGRGVEQNYNLAVKFYEQSAAQGNTRSMNKLGVCYANGYGVGQNPEQAIEWYQKAADAGNNWGFYNIGCVYAYSYGDKDSLDTAITYFQKAFELGIYEALNDLGECYYLKNDSKKAFEYYMQSAKRGNVKAEEWVANAYTHHFNWYGIEYDQYKAEEWYRRAASHGSTSAVKYLKELEEKRNAEISRNLAETKQIFRETQKQIDDLGKSPWERFWSRF